LTGLTLKATTAVFIVAYADHPEPSPISTIELGTIPRLIAKKWCVDEQRILDTSTQCVPIQSPQKQQA
jgi:polyhydroxybutyrate depolymerase